MNIDGSDGRSKYSGITKAVLGVGFLLLLVAFGVGFTSRKGDSTSFTSKTVVPAW